MARCPTEQASQRNGEERVVTEREPEPYTQLYQRTEWAPQRCSSANWKRAKSSPVQEADAGASQLSGQFGIYTRPSKKWGHWGDSSVGIAFATQN